MIGDMIGLANIAAAGDTVTTVDGETFQLYAITLRHVAEAQRHLATQRKCEVSEAEAAAWMEESEGCAFYFWKAARLPSWDAAREIILDRLTLAEAVLLRGKLAKASGVQILGDVAKNSQGPTTGPTPMEADLHESRGLGSIVN